MHRALLDDGYQGQTAKNWLDAHDLEQYVPKEKRKLTSADDSPSPDPRRNPVTVPKRTGDRILPGQVVLSPLAGSPPATTLGPAPVPVPTPAQQRAYMLDDDPPDALPLLPLSQTAEPLGDSNGLDAMLQELFPNGRRDQGRNARASGPRARRPPHSYASMLRDLGFPTENEWEMEDPIVS